MEFFSFEYREHRVSVDLDIALELERVLVDGNVCSVKPMGAQHNGHQFDVAGVGQVNLAFALNPQQMTVSYRLQVEQGGLLEGSSPLTEEARAAIVVHSEEGSVAPQARKRERSWLVLGSIALKLFKSFKVIKVALMAASVAVYSVMFTFEFALALVAVLVFHEYGHMRAMKKFGIPTKGIYLIPFLGGIALGEKSRTQWEEVYISMMGPVYGLIMTAVFYVIFAATGNHFCGLVASTSALLNLVNLFPVYPLDGGRVVKALVFSRRNQWAMISLLALSALCLFFAWKIGMYFLCFFIVVGVLDLITSWSIPLAADMTPLKTYGIWFSALWYLGVAAIFLGMILVIAGSQLPGAEIAVKILQS